MTIVEDYWSSFEKRVDSLSEFLEAAQVIGAYQQATDSRFVWRGASDASWAMHSSLVRVYQRNRGTIPIEKQLRAHERAVLKEARQWGIDWHPSGGRLAAMEVLARLQHYGVPTRMIDFTFSPITALWFAVQDPAPVDGRVFAIDIADRLVDRSDTALDDPWWWRDAPNVGDLWSTRSWIWKAPPLEPRIVRQDGCFLMGGVPSTRPRRNVRTAGGWRALNADEVRQCMSVPFQLITYEQAKAAYAGKRTGGNQPQVAAFTLRVANKEEVRSDLERTFGLSSSVLFPDVPGLATFGTSFR
jgi:FRG domain-containing protein